MKDQALINRGFLDLNPLIIGEEHCAPLHFYGPAVRKYTLIHFILKGSGTYRVGGKSYVLHAGEAFLILPGVVTEYFASEEDPWYYCWIGFDGKLSEQFAKLPPVFPYTKDLFTPFLEDTQDSMREYKIAAKLFELYADLFAGQKHGNHYVRRVRDYITALYMQPLRVEQIAERMNLDRRYLSRLFKEKTGQSIQEYLISVRMKAAKEHLFNGKSVADAARLCGYEDVCNFSKMFKRFFGVSPGQAREREG